MGFNFRSIPFVARARPTGGGGGGLTRTYLGDVPLPFIFNTTSRTINLPATFNSGSRYVVAVGTVDSVIADLRCTIGGTLFDRRIVTTVDDDGATAALFEGVPGSGSTQVVFTNGGGGAGFTIRGGLGAYQISNGAVWQAGVASGAATGDTRSGSINVGTGDLVIGCAAAAGTTADITGMGWAGLTADGMDFDSFGNGYFASAENVTAATPRAVTATRAGPAAGNNNEPFQIVVGRWSPS